MKVKMWYYKTISVSVAILLVISSLIPVLDSRTKAEETIVTETATQRILNFAVNLISGAANKGTDMAPDHIWDAASPQAGHKFKYQLDYDLSGEGEIGAKEIKMILPKHILKDREGTYSDVLDIAIPSESDVSQNDTENKLVFKEENDHIVIYNRLPVSAAEKGSIQFSYATSKQTYQYRDMEASDDVPVELYIDKGGTEHLYTIANGPPVRINTSAEISNMTKSLYYAYNSWQELWGAPLSFGIENADDYLYLVWRVEYDIKATQPYVLSFDDTVTGDYGDASTVGVQINGQNAYSPLWQSNEVTVSGKNLYSFVITKHLKATYDPYITYRIYNKIKATVAPIDEVDTPSTAVSSAVYTYSQPKPDYPIGEFNFWKYNNYSYYNNDRIYNSEVMNYQLTEFRENLIEDIREKMVFKMLMIGYSYPWTIRHGYTTTDVEHYGVEKVTYSMTDDIFFFRDTVTAYHDYDTMETGYVVPEGTEQLDHNDFEITEIDYDLTIDAAVWNTEKLKFDPVMPVFQDSDDVYFYAKFGEDDSWQQAGIFHLKTGIGELLSDKVSSLSDSRLVFANDAECVGYKIVLSNSFYFTRLQVFPQCRIKHSERIHRLIDGAYEDGERRVWLTNIGNVKIYKCENEAGISEDNMIFDKTEFARDYIIGYEKDSDITKVNTFSKNDKISHTVTVGWKVNASESYMTQEGVVYVPQEGGVFYDLIPSGAEPDLSTVTVKAGETELRESQLDISTVANYNDSGRTLLIVRMKERTAEDYTLTYSTVHPWESVFDYGSTIHNSVVYETGNESIANGRPDDGGEIDDTALMRDLDSSTNDKRFLYTQHDTLIDVVIAVNSGIVKAVRADTDNTYSRKTIVHQGQTYVYRLRFQTDHESKAKGIVLYDNIEVFSNPEKGIESQWHGALQSVDVSQLTEAGAAPVIYLSAQTVDIDNASQTDLTNTAVWKKLSDFGDISAARAVAIDVSKDENGDELVLGNNKSLTALLYLKAPAVSPSVTLLDGEVAPVAFNDIAVKARLLSNFSQNNYDDRILEWNYDRVEFRIMSDIPILKADDNDITKPVKGISFRLQGRSDYGNDVDKILESDVDGRLTFKNIEKGTYQLTEYQGSADYQKIDDIFNIVIGNDGKVKINNDVLADGARYLITDKPRIHTDITFSKRNIKNKNMRLTGVQFHLYGTSEYGNSVNKYAYSDDSGTVTFEDIEYGTYSLQEMTTLPGYFLNETIYEVRIDENANYEITGATREKDGSFSVYNEPLHSFTIQKEGYIEIGGSPRPVPGACFNLSGTSDRGTAVNTDKTTQSNGQAYFTDLEAGRYILRETEAPEGYALNTTRYVVTITEDDTITISGSYKNSSGGFVIKNKEDSNVTITKKWVDNETNDTRTAVPVIHLGIEDDTPIAFFYGTTGYGTKSPLALVTDVTNIKHFKHFEGTDDEVQSVINSGKAVRLDDETTDRKIYGWYVSETNAADYQTLYWWSDTQNVYLPQNAQNLWYGLTNCIDIDTRGINTSLITNMNYMFSSCSNLTDLDLESFDSSNVTCMDYAFAYCSKLTAVDLSSLNTSKVTSMYNMFFNCRELTYADLSVLDTSNVTNMKNMFSSCTKLAGVDLSGINTGNVTSMSHMFSYCTGLLSVDLRGLDTSSLTDISNICYECSSLTSFNATGLDLSNVTNAAVMFYNCKALKSIDISFLNRTKAPSLASMFYGCESLTTVNLSDLDNPYITNMSSMFNGCKALTSIDFSSINISNVTNMSSMFSGCTSMTNVRISGVVFPNLQTMSSIFYKCTSLKTIDMSGMSCPVLSNIDNIFDSCTKLESADLSRMNIPSVTSAKETFNKCTKLTAVELSDIEAAELKSLMRMFYNCSALKSIDLSVIHTAKVLSLPSTFYGCKALTSAVIKNMAVSSFNYTFYGCTKLTSIDLSQCDMSVCTDMGSMFYGCTNLRSINLSNCNTDGVTTMSNMFYNCTSLTSLDLSSFSTTRVTNMSNMFYNCSSLERIYASSAWNTEKVKNSDNMFYGCTSLNNDNGATPFDEAFIDKTYAKLYSAQSPGYLRQGTEYDLPPYEVSHEALDEATLKISLFSNSDPGAGQMTSFRHFTGDAEEVQPLIESGAAFRIDNAKTEKKVYAWYISDEAAEDHGTLYWWSDASKVYLPNNLSLINMRTCVEVDLRGLDSSRLTSAYNLFVSLKNAVHIDLSEFDTSNITTMYRMFEGCAALKELDLRNFDTSKVTTMNAMFRDCKGLERLDLSSFDTSNVTDMKFMFRSCEKLKELDLSNFNTSNVTDMMQLFIGCYEIERINLSSFDTSKLTTMEQMFAYCSKLETVDLSNFDAKNVTSMKYMFDQCKKLKKVDLSSFGSSCVTNMSCMFDDCNEMTEVDLGDLDTTHVTDMSYLFLRCYSLQKVNISSFNTSNVGSFAAMFSGCSSLAEVDLSGFETIALSSASNMFNGCSSLKSLDLSGLRTKGTDLTKMFYGCSSLQTIIVSKRWSNTPEKNTSSNQMFYGCTSLKGGNGTRFNSNRTGANYAVIDEPGTPGYLTYKKVVDRVKEMTGFDGIECTLEKVDDKTWTYTFSGLDPNIQYFAWEDELEGYTSLNMGKDNFLTVKNGQGVITNTSEEDPPSFGNLKVTKNVLTKSGSDAVSDADKAMRFSFTVTLANEGNALTGDLVLDTVDAEGREGTILFTAGQASFTLSDDESIKIKGIPSGYSYSVAEKAYDGFDAEVTSGNASGVIAADITKPVVFTNRKNYDEQSDDVTFTVSKRVTGIGTDPNERFMFAADFTGLRNNSNYAVVVGNSTRKRFTADNSGSGFVEFYLKADETASITVPENAAYRITERAGDYTSSYTITDSAGLELITKSSDSNTEENTALSTKTENADKGEQIAIVFTNKKNVRQKLILKKKLENSSDTNTDLFGFTVVFKDLPDGTVISSSLGRLTADDSGTISAYFAISGNAVESFSNIPAGSKYEIIEDESDYVPSFKIISDDETISENAAEQPNTSLSTGERIISPDKDVEVIFTNRKISCDITVTKVVDMTNGTYPENEYKNEEFLFDVRISGLSAGGKRYSEYAGELKKLNTTGVYKTTLAKLMGLEGEAAEVLADRAEFTLVLHHGESFKLKGLPYGAEYTVTERASTHYAASYCVNSNEGALLQANAQENTKTDCALSLNAAEVVDAGDTDIEFVFTNRYDFDPYTLPNSGFDDARMLIATALAGMLLFAAAYLFINRRINAQ